MKTSSTSKNVTVYIRGKNTNSRTVSRKAIARSAMNNAKTSFEIEGRRYSNSDWFKIIKIADQLEAVI